MHCAVPRHLWTTCSPSEMPRAPIPLAEQAVNSRRCFLRAPLGKVISSGLPSQAAMPYCAWSTASVEQWQLPAPPFTLVLLQRGVGSPFSDSVGSLSLCWLHFSELGLREGYSLVAGFKPSSLHFWLGWCFPQHWGLQALASHALQTLELKPMDLPSTAGDRDSPLWWLPHFPVIPDC